MVLFDNLACILEDKISQLRTGRSSCQKWKILGEEPKNMIVVGWTFRESHLNGVFTCVGTYNTKLNSLAEIFCCTGDRNIIQCSVNPCGTMISFVERIDVSNQPSYSLRILPVSGDYNVQDLPPPDLVHDSQIMSTFLDSYKRNRVLVMIHGESVSIYHASLDDNRVEISGRDIVTNAFCWAQWDLATSCLYFINFRMIKVYEGDNEKEEQAPTLTALQFHPDLPHETVLNIPLNLPSVSKSSAHATGLYEDDCVPLRVHDASLDLLVITDPSGMMCICHHYLFQPVKPPTTSTSDDGGSDDVHFAYSVTLLHHGCVIHCTIPGVPWNLVKTLRLAFTMLGSDYLLVRGPGLLTHLLHVGMAHEPTCHIILHTHLESEIRPPLRLVPLHSAFAEEDHNNSADVLKPSIMIDLNTLNLHEIEVTVQDVLATFEEVKSVSNRLAILHFFLVHQCDPHLLEDVLKKIINRRHDIHTTLYLKEVLVGGTYSMTQKHLPTDTANLLCLLPITCMHSAGKMEVTVGGKSSSVTQEILWNTAMMLLSPQQRLIPYTSDIWARLWDKLSTFSEAGRFKHSYVTEKLSASLACYQPEALSRCTTPMSPAAIFFPSCSMIDVSGQMSSSRKSASYQLPFHESDSCTASKQEHVTSVNMRELNMYLMKHCFREAPMHIHAVTTRYITAQLDMSKHLCFLLCCACGLNDMLGEEKGFAFVRLLDEYHGQLLLTSLLRYHHAVDLLAFPFPPGFSSFFCFLGFSFLPMHLFMQHLNSNVFQLQVDVMKEILKESGDNRENVEMKLRLLLTMPRARAKRLLNTWSHPVSVMLRAREHAVNILSGVLQSGRPKVHAFARRSSHAARGLTAFPSGDRVSPLDTFLDLLTAKASLTELDFNLLIEATVLSTEEFL